MATFKITRDIRLLWKRNLHWLHRVNEWSHGWFGIIGGAARQAVKPSSVITAAAIAYFSVFSLFPLSLLSITIASFIFGSETDQSVILQKLEFIAPAFNQLLGKNINEILWARGPITLIAFVSLVWSASTLFYVLTGTMNGIWKIKQNHPVWKRRGAAILFVLFFVVPLLFLASLGGSMITNILNWLPEFNLPIKGGVSFIVATFLDVAMFMALYLILPRSLSGWREILPGAIGAGFLWELAKKAFLYFLSTYISISNLIYGSLSVMIIFLTWAYLSGLIFLFGAYVSASYHRKKQPQ